jgi:hypothetical protein
VPTTDEVATLMVGDGSEAIDRRDVVFARQVGLFQRISELHVGYMALHYPLLCLRMDDIRRFHSMVLLLMQIWMKTIRGNLTFKENIAM